MNMFKPVDAKTIKEYINSIEDPDRKKLILEIDRIIKTSVPSLKPNFNSNMLGYGSFKYINHKKEEVDWPVVSLASQKNYVSVYVCALEKGQYLAESFKSELGKVQVGKSCIKFKKLEDLDLATFKKVLRLAAKRPGFPSETTP